MVGFSLTTLILLVIPLVIFVVVARKRALPWMEIVVLSILLILATSLIPGALAIMTDGRAAIGETLPWVVLLGLATTFGWLFWRTRSRPTAARPRATPEPAPPPVAKPVRTPARETPATGKPKTIFISYRREDSADATGRLYDRLRTEFGREHVYKDVDTIPLGVDFREHITELVGTCDVVLAVIGRQWLNVTGQDDKRRLDDARDPVRIEISSALKRDIPVVPVLVGGSTIPTEETLPPDIAPLAYRNGTKVRSDPDFHNDVDRLIIWLREH